MALVLSVFGNNISIFIYHKIPFLAEYDGYDHAFENGDFICCYDWNFASGISLLPNRKLPFRDLILGSIFCFSGMAGDLVCFFNVSDNL